MIIWKETKLNTIGSMKQARVCVPNERLHNIECKIQIATAMHEGKFIWSVEQIGIGSCDWSGLFLQCLQFFIGGTLRLVFTSKVLHHLDCRRVETAQGGASHANG